MVTPWEIVQKEMIPPQRLLVRNMASACSLFRIMTFNLGTLKRLKSQGRKAIYVRPVRAFEVPEFEPGMKNSSSGGRYLRPTLFCDCRAAEITALAHKLGAFSSTPRVFAEKAFAFAKRKIIVEILPLDDVGQVVRRGTGTCLQKISVFIALCRAAGIPARYKFCELTRLDEIFAPSLENSPLIKKWFDAMGSFLLHGEGEVLIDGQWVTADISSGPQWQAAFSIPITRLGETSVGLWIFPVPGSVFRRESVPLGMARSLKILIKMLSAGSIAGFNNGILEQIEKGRRIIEAAGGETAYDAEARRNRGQVAAQSDLLQDPGGIVFTDELK